MQLLPTEKEEKNPNTKNVRFLNLIFFLSKEKSPTHLGNIKKNLV